jgi:1-deoxy-D-xylulose-5-phosphate reductoisomerase
MNMQNLVILGATGAIGCNTLEVVALHPDRYRVFALTAHGNVARLREQCQRFQPRFAVVGSEAAAVELRAGLTASTEVLWGPEALQAMARHPDVDVVMAAIVGAAGLASTLAAALAGKRILLANKEALVIAGALLMDAIKTSGAILLPVDSEHNAVFQSLPREQSPGLGALGVKKITLTASGGPFLNRPLSDLARVTVDEACKHPNWVMGRKISVDSATMMNKGLELIEACWLFNATPAQIDILIHPQSIIHSMVAYADGSVIAQLGCPDMRTPIAHALAYPERIESGAAALNLAAVGSLHFETLDPARFPCVSLARRAISEGGTAPAILNAANEVAVAAFLEGGLRFDQIPRVIEAVMDAVFVEEGATLAAVLAADAHSRIIARSVIEGVNA